MQSCPASFVAELHSCIAGMSFSQDEEMFVAFQPALQKKQDIFGVSVNEVMLNIKH